MVERLNRALMRLRPRLWERGRSDKSSSEGTRRRSSGGRGGLGGEAKSKTGEEESRASSEREWTS